MPRVEVELDDQTYHAVARYASASGRPISIAIRDLCRAIFGLGPVSPPSGLNDFSFIGAGRAGQPGRVSEEHDAVLGEKRW